MVKDLNDPTNRDTVPAMLTPGEFVLNKEATQMYGDVVHQMNQHGLMQRHMENQMNIGGKVKKLYEEGYTAPGQAYAIAKSMGYNEGGFIDFIKKHEGWRDTAYDDGTGVWTIGYGRTTNPDGSKIQPGQTTTRDAENTWLTDRVQAERDAVDAHAQKYGYDWTPQERDALASFRYNAGAGNFNTLTGDGTRSRETIIEKFPQYNKGGGEFMQGLQNRRNYEMELAGWGNTQPVQGTNMVDFIPTAQEQAQNSVAAAVPQVQQPVPQEANQVSDLGGEALASLLFRSLGYNQGGPVYLNEGGFWSGVKNFFTGGGDNSALAGRPGIRSADPFQGTLLSADQIPADPTISIPALNINPPQEVAPLADVNTASPTAIHAGNRFNFAASPTDSAPSFDATPPKQGPTAREIWNNLKEQRDSYPKGSPERTNLSNLMNQINVNHSTPEEAAAVAAQAHAATDPAQFDPRGPNQQNVPPPRPAPAPGSDEAILQTASQSAQEIGSLPIGDPRRMQAIENGTFIPTEGDLEWEEQAWRTNEALQQAQLQAAVTAPDAPGAEFIQQRVNALTDQASSLGIPADVAGVGADVNVGGINPPPELGSVPGMPLNPNAVGSARPILDGSVPTPEQVIQNQPQDIWGGMDTILPTEDEVPQAVQQAELTQAPAISAPYTPPVLPEGLAGESIDDIEAAKEPPAQPLSKDNAPQTRVATEEKVAEILGDETPMTTEEAAVAESAGSGVSEEQKNRAADIIKENFGGLFDKKELARAAVLFAGAMVTGMSPQRALAYAGTNYINRIDAKEALQQKTAAEAQKAAAKNAPYRTGNRETFYSPDGNKIEAVEVKRGKDTMFVNPKTGEEIPMGYTQDAAQVKGTPEYNKAVQQSAKNLQPLVEENMKTIAKNEFGDRVYASGLKPAKVSHDVAEWAAENNIDPTQMGSTIQAAMAAAQRDNADGNTPKSFKAYLNDQAITARVGDPTLFEGSSAKEVNKLMDNFSSRFRGMPAYQGKSDIEISTVVMQKARPHWAAVPEDQKRIYEERAKANPNKSAFMFWLEDEFNGRTLANKVGE